MATPSHPTSRSGAPSLTFVVALHFGHLRRGLAGPFPTEDAAEAWVRELIGDERGWTWVVDPVTTPAALPLAVERAAAKRAARRHLQLVRT